MGYSIVSIKPAVQILPVHAKGEHLVAFTDRMKLEDIDTDKIGMLEAFYELCASSDEPRELGIKYTLLPRFYSWSNKKWKRRKKAENRFEVPQLGQMITVGPQAGERWFLYLLLLHKVAPISEDDLRTGAFLINKWGFSKRSSLCDGS